MSLETVSKTAGDDSAKPILSAADKMPADLPVDTVHDTCFVLGAWCRLPSAIRVRRHHHRGLLNGQSVSLCQITQSITWRRVLVNLKRLVSRCGCIDLLLATLNGLPYLHVKVFRCFINTIARAITVVRPRNTHDGCP